MERKYRYVSFLQTGGVYGLQFGKQCVLSSMPRRKHNLSKTCFIPRTACVFPKDEAFDTIVQRNMHNVKSIKAILELGSSLRSNEFQNGDQGLDGGQNSQILKPYKASLLDLLIIAAFCSAFLLSSAHFRRLSRAHALVGVFLFAVQAVLYHLRVRYIYMQWQKESNNVQADVEQVSKRLELNEQKINSIVKDVMRSEISGFKSIMNDTDTARVQKDSSYRKSVEDGIHTVNTKLTKLQDTFLAQARDNAESDFAVEVETLRAKLKESEKAVVSLQFQVQSLERSLASSKSTIATARQDAEIAAEREMLLRADIVALSRRAEEANSIRERLFAAETRNAALEQSVLQGSRTQEDLRIKAKDAEQRISSMSQVTNMLRESLLSIGKTFPTAGRLLFDDIGGRPSEAREKQDPRLFGKLPKSQYSASGIDVAEMKERDNTKPMTWPNSVLDSGSVSDVGLPEDGGFGTDHYAPEKLPGGAKSENEDPSRSPFSSLRGAFREHPQIESEVKENNSSTRLHPENKLSNDAETDISSVESQSSSEEFVRDDLEKNGTVLSNLGNRMSPVGAEHSSAETPSTASENFVPTKSSSRPTSSIDERNTSWKDTASLGTVSTFGEEDSFPSSDEVSGSERSLTDDSTGVISNGMKESPSVANITPANAGSSVNDAASLETLLSEARELVKRGRRKDIGESQSAVFSEAVLKLSKGMHSFDKSVPVMAEYGSALIAWARCDLSSKNAEKQLEQARDLLNMSVAEEPENEGCLFNLGLCLCLLASLKDIPACEELYTEACVYYDRLIGLGTKSRIVFFNSGLAYISRARIGQSSEAQNSRIVREMYKKASDMFASALELQPEDSKSRIYLDECMEKVKAEDI